LGIQPNIPEIAPSGKCGTNEVAIADEKGMQHNLTAFAAFAILPAAILLSAALIVALRLWLGRYAIAMPNARSSHKVPTPQGGGAVEVLGHGVLLVLWSPLPDSSLAGQEHGRTIPLAEVDAQSRSPLPDYHTVCLPRKQSDDSDRVPIQCDVAR
jgi:hypothetical protein